MSFYEVASVISPLLILIGCWRQRFTLLWFYAAAGFITDLLSYIVTEKKMLGNTFLLVEFLILSFYYRKQIFRSNVLFAIITTCISAWFVLKTINKPNAHLNLEDASLFCLMYVIYGLVYFYLTLKREPQTYNGINTSELGVNIAIFVYASGALMLFLFSPLELMQNTEQFIFLWQTLFWGLNIFRYSLIAFAIYQKPKYNAG